MKTPKFNPPTKISWWGSLVVGTAGLAISYFSVPIGEALIVGALTFMLIATKMKNI